MRQFRRSVSLVLVLLLVLGLSISVGAYETVSLTGEAAGTGAQTPSTVKTVFSVNMGSTYTDGLTIYKIADAVYDPASNSMVVTWTKAPGDPNANPSFADSVGGGQNWIAELTTTGWLLQDYQTPNALGEATAATQKSVLTTVAKYIDTGATSYAYGNNHKTAVQKALTAGDKQIVFTKSTETGNQAGVYTFTESENIPFGLYLAFDETYTPYTINLVPEQQDDGTWVIPNNQFGRKFSGADLVKTVDKDQVAVGETVEFTIEAGIPGYSPALDDKHKIFTIDDDMSTAFAYNKGTLVIEYIPGDGSDPITIPENYNEASVYAAVISSDVTVYSCPTSSHQYFNIYEVIENGTYYYYFLKDDVMNLLYSTGSKASNTLSYSGPVFKEYQALTGDKISHGLSPLNMDKNLFNINFNYGTLAAWMTANELSGGSVRITYEATVTENAKINSDANYNTAVLRYAKDESGTIERLDDTVHVYTYGINIVKVNGDTLTAAGQTSNQTEYLAGAVFSLYKLVPRESEKTYYEVTAFDANGAATEGADKEAFNLAREAIMANDQVPYALPNMVTTTTGEEGSTVTTTTTQQGYHLYGKIKGDIQSVASAAGVQVNGVGPGTYLLIEELAPSGYNLLNQGIRFTINATDLGTVTDAMSEGEEPIYDEYGKRGSLTGFYDSTEAAAYHANGYYDLLVSNFKGLTLPETGGMGTAQFTGFGLLLMTAAMYILVMKKRRMA